MKQTLRRPIEAVLFDGDDTLWDFTGPMRRALRLTLDELWSRRPDTVAAGLTVERLVEIRDRVAGELAGRVLDLETVRLAAFERTLEEIGIADSELPSELLASYLAHVARWRRLGDDTRAVLGAVGRFRLGLVTNGTVRLEDVGLAGVFDVVVRGADVGSAKPDPEIFFVALRRLDVEPERAVHVGDSLEHDVAGASAAGLRTVWLCRPGEDPATSPIAPDGVINGLAELPAMLAGWSQ